MPAGRPKGSRDAPRERMLRLIEERWPAFSPALEMLEQCMIVKADLDSRTAARLDDIEMYKQGELDFEEIRDPIPTSERAELVAMIDKPARYLLPQLKAQDIKIEGAGDGFVFKVIMDDKGA